MLRVLRATAARKSRTSFFLSSARKLCATAILPKTTPATESASSVHPLPVAPFFIDLRTFSSSEKLHNGHSRESPELSSSVLEKESHEASDAHQADIDDTLTTQQLADASEPSKSAKEEYEGLSASDADDKEEDEDEGEDEDEDEVEGKDDPHAESGKEITSDSIPETEEDSVIDMRNVPEDLKEMMQDSYEYESAEEDFPSGGPIELLTLGEVKHVLEEVRARDVQIFSVQDRCEWTDLMVVATGISDRHVRGIADALVFKIKKKGVVEPPLYPTIEGQVGGKWLVVDCGNIVIHVLDEESRAYYKLEDLWTGEIRPSTTDEDLETMLRKAGLNDVVP